MQLYPTRPLVSHFSRAKAIEANEKMRTAILVAASRVVTNVLKLVFAYCFESLVPRKPHFEAGEILR